MDTHEFNKTIDGYAALELGTSGLLGGLAQMMEAQGVAAPGLDELWCVTGAAFSNYVFEPEYNPVEERARGFCEEGELFSNYGTIESFGGYTGMEVREFNFLSAEDFTKLVAFELMQGRAVLTMGIEGPRQPQLITGIDAGAQHRKVRVVDAAGPERWLDIWGLDSAQGDDEDFVNWCVIMRFGERSVWSLSHNKLRINAVRWAIKHGQARKEFFHETRINYAPGLRGLESMSAQLGALVGAELSAGWRRYLGAHVRGLIEGSEAIVARLPAWCDDLLEDEAISVRDEVALRESAEQAVRAYEAGAAALSGHAPAVEVSAEFISAYNEFAGCVGDALDALARVLDEISV